MSILKKKSQLKLVSLQLLIELQKIEKQKEKQKVVRRCWVKPMMLRRTEFDLEECLLSDLLWEDAGDFQNFTRLHIGQFEELWLLVHDQLKKADTEMRLAITPRTKFAITLRYLATGDSFKSLQFLTRVSKSAISAFVPEVLRELILVLKDKYIKMPNTEAEWLQVATDFDALWQIPHTLGALDGKHIRIKAPANSGWYFYNYKGFHSIVLFAAVDAHSRFLFIDVGCNGKASDSTIFHDGYLYQSMKNGTLNIPKSCAIDPKIPDNTMPYFFIGDDAFQLDKHLMKPYNRSVALNVSRQIFNYRISRARMSVECAFGRLASRFRILHRPIEVLPSTVDRIVIACCTLHNFLTKPKATPTFKEGGTDDELPETFHNIGEQVYNTNRYASRTREELARFFVSNGKIENQWKKININKET